MLKSNPLGLNGILKDLTEISVHIFYSSAARDDPFHTKGCMALTIPLKSSRIECNTEGFDWDKRTGQTKIELRPREEILTGCDARTLENDQIKEDNSCFNL